MEDSQAQRQEGSTAATQACTHPDDADNFTSSQGGSLSAALQRIDCLRNYCRQHMCGASLAAGARVECVFGRLVMARTRPPDVIPITADSTACCHQNRYPCPTFHSRAGCAGIVTFLFCRLLLLLDASLLELLTPAEFYCEVHMKPAGNSPGWTFCLNLLSPADCRFLSTYSAFRGSACGLLLGSDPQPLPPVPLQTPRSMQTAPFYHVGSLTTGATASGA